MTNNDTTIKLIRPFQAQQEIIVNAKRNNLLILARRWGKTTISSHIVKRGALLNEDRRCAWSAPTWKLMMETFEEYRDTLSPATTRVNREDRRIELVNGSVIEFWSSDDTQAGRGRKYHIWVSDESQRQRNLSKFIRGSVRPTLADFRGQLWVLGTANGEGSELHDFYLDCVEDNKNWFVAHGALAQNPYIHPDEVAQLRRDLGPDLAAQELDSLWVRVDGIIPLVRKQQWNVLYAELENKTRTKALAVDASIKGDLTAVVGVWGDDQIYCDYGDIQLLSPDPITGEIDYNRLEKLLTDLWATGRYHVIAYDPYQMVGLAQRLRAKGVRTLEFTQNAMRLKSDSYLRQIINEGRFHHPEHDMLTEHVLCATLKYTQDSFRLVKGTKTDKIDLAVALSMACWALKETKSLAMRTFTPAVGDPPLDTRIANYIKDLPYNPFTGIGDMNPWK